MFISPSCRRHLKAPIGQAHMCVLCLATKGQWSVEIWIRTGYAFAAAGAANAPVHTLTQQGITVLLAEPRRLILRLVCGKFRAVLAALHGPHRAVESGIIDAWWSEISKHLSQATPL